MDDFREQWEPAVDKLDKAAKAFEGLTSTISRRVPRIRRDQGSVAADGVEGARLAAAQTRGAARVARSRAKPGRGAGRGPLRRAPRQRERDGMPLGLGRSPLEPEETTGLCRSDDISRMLPSEMALIANGSRPARLLHFARRAERTLLSYERVGWSEEPAVTIEGTEIRPAAECGPIILCLDTSGSMMGARETVAKAMVLECMRQAKSQQRQCYLYSFSGPGDCQSSSSRCRVRASARCWNSWRGRSTEGRMSTNHSSARWPGWRRRSGRTPTSCSSRTARSDPRRGHARRSRRRQGGDGTQSARIARRRTGRGAPTPPRRCAPTPTRSRAGAR